MSRIESAYKSHTETVTFYKPWTWFSKRWTVGEALKASVAGGVGLILIAAA